jgi:hypothetical protein
LRSPQGDPGLEVGDGLRADAEFDEMQRHVSI